jgi:hypothetical protein
VNPPGDDGGGTSSGNTSSGSGSGSSSGNTSSGSGSGSSSGNTSSGSGSGSGGGSSSGVIYDGGNQLQEEASADGGCPQQSNLTLGVHINFQVSWPSSIASNAGNGPVDIWLLSSGTTSGTGGLMVTGTARSCGTRLPDIALNGVGIAAVCAPGHTCGTKVQIAILDSTFASITRTFPTTGTQDGWGLGSTLATAPALGLLGLKNGTYSAFNAQTGDPTTAWPSLTGCTANCTPEGVFMSSDNSDDDMDGNVGITANPKNDTGASPTYTYPPTGVTFFAIPPLADKVYIASRNVFEISGMRTTSCTSGTGTVKVTAFDNHVLGCHSLSTSTDNGVTYSGGPGACISPQVSFLDQNRTIYGPYPVPSGCGANCIANAAHPITGTAKVVQLTSAATCADVLAIQ